MDAPVDFSRARHLGNGNLGNYDQGFNENVHTTRPGSTSVSLPEIARVGTPTPLPGLGQFPSRFMHPSLISTAGAGYPLLSNLGYLPASGGASGAAALGSGSGLMGDHLKSLLPDLQQYPWNSPGEGRYALNNNNIYSTQYLNYIHGNESLPLFPTSASVGNSTAPAQVQAQMLAAYHRIYDLQKEVMLASHANPSSSALHSPYAPGISPPVTRMSNDLHSPTAIAGKKEHNRSHSESKQRSSESTSKSHGKAGDGSSSLKQHGGKSGKEGRDSKRQCKTDRKGDCKESERRTETRDTKDRALSSKSDTKSSEKKSCEVQQEQTTSQNVVTEKNCSSDQDKNKCDVDGDETELEIDVPGEDNVIKSNLESSAKSESTKFLGSVSPSSGKELSDSSFSMVVTHAPSQCAISPPMFHCSKSEMMVSPGSAKSGSSGEGRKIHAPTFTPEIGTLPSVVAVANMPIQTTACDMRIKKEKVTYSSCKNKGMTSCPRTCETNLKQGDSLKPGIDKDFSNGDGKRKLTKRITDNQEKTRKKSDKGVVHPVKHTPEKSSRQNNSKDKLKHDEQLTNQDDDENICVTLNPFEHGRKEKSKNQSSENMDSENINLKKCSERHSLTSNQELRNSHKDSDFSAIDICNQTNISESIEKCDKDEKDAKYNGEDKEEKDDNGKIHTSQVTMPSGVKLSQAQARTQSKLSEKLLRARELNKKGGKRKDDNSSGMSIPIGIAVAQKREELKEESPGTENRNREDAHQRGGLHGNTSGLHRVDGGQSSAFIGPILPKSTNNSGHVSVADIRNSLPSNLIVTGSASGTGIAWADDPTTRSFTSPWIAAGPPPSWISQVPFPLHSNIPTSLATGEQPSLTVPPGYKLIQDSVTGQLVLLPSTSFSDVYDPSRMWNPSIANMASGSTFQQLMAVHHQSSLAPPVLNRQADLALVVQRYQQQLQSMYQHLPHTESSFQNVGINLSLPMKSVTPKEVCKDDETKVECVKDVDESKDVDVMTTKDDDEEENENEIEGEIENRKTPSSVKDTFVNKKEPEHKIDFNDNKEIETTSESDSIRFLSRDFSDEKNEETKPNNTAQSPLDYTSLRNAKCYSPVEKSSSIVDESLFQSNLHDAPDQKTLKVLDENISNISQTSLNCGLLVSEGIVREGEKIKNLPSDSVRVKVEDDVKFPKIHVIDQTVASEIKTSDGSSSDSAENKLHSSCEISCDEGKTRENDNCVQQTDSSSAAKNDPYPFLDPQILMAADGLELLSVLAEQRSKCLEVSQTQDNSKANSEIVEKQKTLETETQIPLPNKSEITCNNIENNKSPKRDDFKKTDNTELGPCKSKLSANSSNGNKNDGPIARKRTFSRTRSIPPKSEINSDQSDYYTSTGLRIPQGEEEINAIELDMRIRLAELQRQYKEKQKQLAKLHPKKDRDRSKEKTKDKVKDKNKSKEKEKDKGKEKERENKGHDKEREKERTKEAKKEQVTDKDADRDYDNRKPGRPKKKGKLPENKSDPLTNKGNGKGKDIPRKRKQAEELVDRVFRKTGGGFGMPLSKKLKANAMASLFKTQSGFTVKRKNSSSSSSSVLPFSTKTDKDRPTESLKAKKSLTKFMSAGAFSSEKETQKYKKLPAFGERYTNDKSPSYSQASDEKEESDTKSTLGIKAEKKLIKPFTGNSPEEKTAPSASLFKLENGHSEKVSKTVENDTSPPKKIKLIKTDSLSENQTNNLPESVPRPVTPPHCSEHAHADLTNPLDSPASSTKKGSEGESSSESTPSMHKKRKPGRPRKYNSNTTPGVTETIVARHSKSFFYNQFHSFEDVVKAHNSQEKKVKIENPTSMKPLFLDEEWLLRRSERIFLSEPSPQPSPNTSKEPQKSPVNTTSSLKRQSSTLQPSPLTSQSQETASQAKEEKNKKQKALSIKEITEKVKKKYSKTFKLPQGKIKPRSSSLDSKEHTLKKKEKIKSMEPSESQLPKMPAEDQSPDSSDSEGDNLPLSVLRERPEVPAPRSCAINKSELINGLRVLVFKDGLFYEGAVQEIHPPDVYGVLIDNERGNRPIIYSQEEILKEVIVDVRPSSSKTLVEGTRVCAYWSQQFSCLYPGTVAKASPNPHSDISLTNVEFDDGDSGKIPLDHIRMLPQDFPLVAYDPNPLLLIGKRRRHTTNESTDTSRRRSVSVTDSNKSKRGRPPKGKKSDRNNVDDDYEEGEEEEVDVCGFDDDPDDVFENDKNKAKFKTLNAKKKRKRQVTTSDSETDDRNNAKDKHFSDEDDDDKSDEEDNEDGDDAEYSPKKKRKEDRNTSSDQVVTPARQLWKWSGTSTKRPGLKGKAKKEYYKAIVRGKEKIEVGECAVFLSTGRPHLPYIGRIHSMWEAWGGQMVVKVKWFYHPEETRGGKKLQDMKGALFQSLHMDENDVQTISHKCEVVSCTEYRRRCQETRPKEQTLYYLGGTYEPTIGLLKFEKDMGIV